jgi:phospholipid/cholesterol/gamma-HCH transport system substrate-binding protein
VKALALLVLLLGAAAATGVTIFQRSRPYEVTAYVLSAAQVVPGNDVVMGGVPVGHVSAVAIAPDTTGPGVGAQVTMQLEQRYAPLHRGTRVTIRPKGLLGNMFVELTPSGAAGIIPSGGTIPVQDTAAPVTLDQVTDIFDAQTRQALQTLNRQGGVALQGRGPDVNHVLQRLPQVSSDLAATAGALDSQDQELNALAIEFDRVAAQVAGEDRSLRGDVQNGAALLDTLAAHQQQLQDELTAANASLGALNGALDGHQAALKQLLEDQPALLQQLQQFEAASTTTFGTIDPCVGDLFNTLGEMRSATDYSHPAGSTDGNGFMLRVDPQLVGATNGTLTPAARCSG